MSFDLKTLELFVRVATLGAMLRYRTLELWKSLRFGR